MRKATESRAVQNHRTKDERLKLPLTFYSEEIK